MPEVDHPSVEKRITRAVQHLLKGRVDYDALERQLGGEVIDGMILVALCNKGTGANLELDLPLFKSMVDHLHKAGGTRTITSTMVRWVREQIRTPQSLDAPPWSHRGCCYGAV